MSEKEEAIQRRNVLISNVRWLLEEFGKDYSKRYLTIEEFDIAVDFIGRAKKDPADGKYILFGRKIVTLQAEDVLAREGIERIMELYRSENKPVRYSIQIFYDKMDGVGNDTN